MTVGQLPNGRWRARVWSKGRNVPVTRVLGMEATSFDTREQAQYYYGIAHQLLATKYGNPNRPRKPKPLKYWCVDAKKESRCRACNEPAAHLHHIVPRAMHPEGAKNFKENGIPLCRRCHRRWHSRVIEIPHGILTKAEFGYACRAAGVDWVARHYFDPEQDAVARYRAMHGKRLKKELAPTNRGQVEHPTWCESNFNTTVAPYGPKPCNCGISRGQVER